MAILQKFQDFSMTNKIPGHHHTYETYDPWDIQSTDVSTAKFILSLKEGANICQVHIDQLKLVVVVVSSLARVFVK